MKFGTTYSHRQIAYLKLNHNQAFSELLNFGFDTIRLACYWNEIEKQPGIYDLTVIRSMLEECEKRKQKVVVTIGMKAPRYPEFYIPAWLEKKEILDIVPHALTFIETGVKQLKKYSCITHWQVENEPLDPSGPRQKTIPLEILKKEAELVRKLDPKRKILLTIWGNELTRRNLLGFLMPLTDIIGIDLYYKVPLIPFVFTGPLDSDATISRVLNETEKEVWIAELQAEPWGFKNITTKSIKEYVLRAKKLNPTMIFLWGFEHWLLKKQKGDDRLWNTVKNILMDYQRSAQPLPDPRVSKT